MGSAIFITVALVLALGFAGWRRLQARAEARARAAAPGASRSNPLSVRGFRGIDEAVAGQRCACGGHMDIVGEGPVLVAGRELRRVHMRCFECEDDRALWVEVEGVLH